MPNPKKISCKKINHVAPSDSIPGSAPKKPTLAIIINASIVIKRNLLEVNSWSAAVMIKK